MQLVLTAPLSLYQDVSMVELTYPPLGFSLTEIAEQNARVAKNYSKALRKTPAPKATRVSTKSLELKQKRYAARAAAYSKAVGKTNQILTSAKPSHKPKPLVIKACAKPQIVRARRSHRAHRTPSPHASASGSASSGSEGPPRPRVFVPSPTDAFIEALRAEFPNASIITAAWLAEIERSSFRMRGAEDTMAFIAQILKGLTHYAVRLDSDLVQDAGDDDDDGSDYQIIAPVELTGETLSARVAEILAVNPCIKFLQVDQPGPEISLRDLHNMTRAQRDEFFRSFIPSQAVVRTLDLRFSR